MKEVERSVERSEVSRSLRSLVVRQTIRHGQASEMELKVVARDISP